MKHRALVPETSTTEVQRRGEIPEICSGDFANSRRADGEGIAERSTELDYEEDEKEECELSEQEENRSFSDRGGHGKGRIKGGSLTYVPIVCYR